MHRSWMTCLAGLCLAILPVLPLAGTELGDPAYRATADRPLACRGDGTGHFPGASLSTTTWDTRSLEHVRWHARLPAYGRGSPLVYDGRVYLTADPNLLLCYDADSGEELWRCAIERQVDQKLRRGWQAMIDERNEGWSVYVGATWLAWLQAVLKRVDTGGALTWNDLPPVQWAVDSAHDHPSKAGVPRHLLREEDLQILRRRLAALDDGQRKTLTELQQRYRRLRDERRFHPGQMYGPSCCPYNARGEAADKGMRTGFCSPVIADGRVYLAWVIGNGEHPNPKALNPRKARRTEANADTYDRAASALADFEIVCLDFVTGKTLWRTTWEDSCLNLYGSAKGGGHFSPCVAEGRVYVADGVGRLCCVDATTGEKLWRAEVPHGMAEGLRKELAQTRAALQRFVDGKGEHPRTPHGSTDAPNGATVHAEGIVAYSCGGQISGFDAESGEHRWTQRCSSGGGRDDFCPVTWRHGGRTYILGGVNCIDPRTGEEIWTFEEAGFADGGTTPEVDGDLVLYGVGRYQGETCGASAWRMSPTGVELVWMLEENEYVRGPHTSPLIHRGHAYLHCGNAKGRKNEGYILKVAMATGNKVVQLDRLWHVKLCTSPVAMADRLIVFDASSRLYYYDISGTAFEELTTIDSQGAINAQSLTPALADGFMVTRGDAHVVCYDLRAR